jgi:hypothetical protein
MRLRINTSLSSVVTNVTTVKTEKLFAYYHITQTVSTNSKNFRTLYDAVLALSLLRLFNKLMVLFDEPVESELGNS